MNKPWPALEYNEWKETYHTLHRWLQIVGKLKLSLCPWVNHSWHATFFVSSRGLTTSSMPYEDKILTVEFDFIDHKLSFQDSTGREHHFMLQNESVSSFHGRFLTALKSMGIKAHIDPHPNECADYIPFDQDVVHKTYVKQQAQNLFLILVRIQNVFQNFRTRFVGKCSPVHFFWGSFDLAVTRFSGRTAPEHPGIAPHISSLVMKEAYSHEVSSCGFWPGNEMYPHAAFYSYAYPEPPGFADAPIRPFDAFYHPDLKEFILPYEKVIQASDPEKTIMDFLNTTYVAASTLGNWPVTDLEETKFLHKIHTLENEKHITF